MSPNAMIAKVSHDCEITMKVGDVIDQVILKLGDMIDHVTLKLGDMIDHVTLKLGDVIIVLFYFCRNIHQSRVTGF